ncbi:MAG: hypothetical protein ABJQ71_22680 [Roseibium sp.]
MVVRRNKSRQPVAGPERPALTPLQQALLEEANRKVTIGSDGQQQEVSIDQVVSRKLLQMAANGSVHALSNAVNEINAAQRLQRQQIDEDVDFGRRFKEHQQGLLDQATNNCDAADTVLPHPDDIHAIIGKGYQIRGPADEAELKTIKTNCALRDVLILHATLEERIGGAKPDPDCHPTEEPFAGATAMILAHVMNIGLPERFAKSDTDLTRDLMHHGRMTKRQLLKEAHRAWAAIGRPKARGWTLPPYQETLARLEQCASVCADLAHTVKTGKHTSDREIAAEIMKVF